MSDKPQAIVLARRVRTESVVNAFFLQAYHLARDGDDEQKAIDSERVQGCVVDIMLRRNLDPRIESDMAIAAKYVGNCLSLGLEASAQSDPEKAVRILRKNPIEEFYQLGRVFHEEICADAEKILYGNIITIHETHPTKHERHYGILDSDLETDLRKLCDKHLVFDDVSQYRLAVDVIHLAKTLLALAKAFPLKGMFDNDFYQLRHYRHAYKRSRTKTSQTSGLLSLVLRSYLIKSLTVTNPALKLPNYCDGVTKADELIEANFTVKTDDLKRLVEDVFFEPRKVANKAAECIAALNRYLNFKAYGSEGFRFFFNTGVYAQPALPKPTVELALDFATELLRRFVDSVREYFITTDEVDVSDTSIAKFWANWIICYQVGSNVDRELKKIADKISPEAVLKAPPGHIADYVRNAGSWPVDFRESVINNYDWTAFYRSSLNDDSISKSLDIILRELGGRVIIPSLKTPRGHVGFWMYVWSSCRSAAHDEILKYMRQMGLKLNPQILARALEETPGLGKDERLLRLFVERILTEQNGADEKIHNCSADTWNSIIFHLWRFDNIEGTQTLPFIARFIPERTLQDAVAQMPSGANKDSIVSVLTGGTADAKK